MVRKPLKSQLIVTSQGRKEKQKPSGIMIQGSSIVANHRVNFNNKVLVAWDQDTQCKICHH